MWLTSAHAYHDSHHVTVFISTRAALALYNNNSQNYVVYVHVAIYIGLGVMNST